jgi:hypothetical protein
LRNKIAEIKLRGMKKPTAPAAPVPSAFKAADVQAFIDDLFGDDLHAKRVRSLADATVGALHAGALGIHAIGRGLAAARGLLTKHAVKQADRLVGNCGISVWALFGLWVPFVLAQRKEVRVNMDWTEFDKDGHSMLVLSVQTNHGRATPLLWKTFGTKTFKGHRNDYEDELLVRLREVIPRDVAVTIVADRGFADTKLYEFLAKLGFGYVIRFRSIIHVTDQHGTTRKAKEWLGPGGKLRVFRNAQVTGQHVSVPTVVCVQDKEMKDAWCIVASDPKLAGRDIKAMYGKRFSIEEMFRDQKDLRFGMGLGWRTVGDTGRRDRLMLIAALAQALLTLLGAAGESLGFDRMLKTNTVKTRTISLFRQGLMWYELIPMMPEERLRALVTRFGELLAEQAIFQQVLGVI